jgi:hypothetical protein
MLTELCSQMPPEVKVGAARTARISRSVVCPGWPDGYAPGMSPFEDFVDEVEVSITDAVDSMDDEESARLYAEVLDIEQRLEALHDALDVLAAHRP